MSNESYRIVYATVYIYEVLEQVKWKALVNLVITSLDNF